MATNKRVFTLRLDDEVFERIGALATAEHRSMTNYIEFVLLKHLEELDKNENTGKDSQLLFLPFFYAFPRGGLFILHKYT